MVGWTFTLSAIQLAFACVGYRAISLLDRDYSAIWRSALTAIVLFAVVALHPTLTGMVSNASNDGSITFGSPALIVMSAALAFGLTLLAARRKSSQAAFTDPLLGLGVGLLAALLMQAFAWWGLGYGSSYAVKKHGFLICGTAIVVWAIIAAQYAKYVWHPQIKPGFQPVLLPAVAFALFAGSFGLKRYAPLEPVVRYERNLRDLVAAHPYLRGKLYSLNRHLSPTQNFTAAMAATEMLHSVAREHHLRMINRRDPKALKYSEYIVLAPKEDALYPPTCHVVAHQDFLVINAKCYNQKQQTSDES